MVAETILNVDLTVLGAIPVVYAKQEDKDARTIVFHLFSGGQAFEIPSGTAAVFRALKPDGTGVFYDAEISGNTVCVALKQQVLAADGEVVGEINLFNADERLSTFNFLIIVSKAPIKDETIVSSDYFTALQGMISTIMQSATVVKPLGAYDTVLALSQAVTNPSIGDMYMVGTQEPYTFYFWTGAQWADAGTLSGVPGPAGEMGPYFTPNVDDQGNITWSNNGGLENPQAQNIKGPKGDTGTGLTIMGYYSTLAALQSAVPAPNTGDAYGVGSSAPYDIYIFADGQWVNNGHLQGPAGADGVDGADGSQGPQGPQGAPGPNSISTETQAAITGLIKGAGGYAAQAVPGTDYAMPAAKQAVSDASANISLVDNTEYRFSTSLTALTVVFPSGDFEAWLRFTAGNGFALNMPSTVRYIGSVPTFSENSVYEMSIKDGVAVIVQVTAT